MTSQPPDDPQGSDAPLSPIDDTSNQGVTPVGAVDAAQPAVASMGEDAPAPSRKRWIAAAVAALGVALFAVPLLRGPESSTGNGGTCTKTEGTANFDFTLKDMSGADVHLADYKGKVVLLNFWATWCGPCKMEIPEFVDAYAQYRDRGFVILGVLSEDDPSQEELRAFTSEFKMNYPVFRVHEGLENAFGPLWALPTTFLVDRHGAICLKHMGPVSKEMLEHEIRGLL